jgi:hypothetical protein
MEGDEGEGGEKREEEDVQGIIRYQHEHHRHRHHNTQRIALRRSTRMIPLRLSVEIPHKKVTSGIRNRKAKMLEIEGGSK